ncbi:beta-1,4-N-acetylgalactosaminyltransferase [Selenomonas ruminis]|uniref:Beta-1,4-N-acetylgalactosaminyltransferase n=1 Tax=Selenomonas ruminis TaxID=2593411 RepID=A0A5D6W6I7_9FIRM|nr:beta-1,4-N-acetylgalactosaminyltransferase [Selenomonas sp. mPRGC5]TYZ24071.1 beta-1,4-N-acetylgalactosaminyltransferase [Selenomonas sp. mPRGC5]
MRIYDCFTFYNEIELLEWRLKMLYDVVDFFVIVEANRTFQNGVKPFYLEQQKDKIAQYWDKIRYLQIEDGIPYTDDWSIEIYQRNYIRHGLTDCHPDDIVIIGDVDELPDPNVLRRMKEGQVPVNIFKPSGYVAERSGVRGLSRNGRCLLKALPYATKKNNLLDFLDHSPVVCEQRMFEFFANYECPYHWCGSIISKGKNFTTPQGLRRLRNNLPLVEGGWHFSSLGGVEVIKRKIYTTSDGMNNEVLKMPENERDAFIKKQVEQGCIWWSNTKLKKLPREALSDIPEYDWFIEKYPQMTV